jgi:hypothetical protein
MAFTAYSAAALIEHPAVARQRLQRKLEAAIDLLILALDRLDGDADLEPGADLEPSLSFTLAFDQDNALRSEPLGNDCIDAEEACEDEGAEHDGREPERYN